METVKLSVATITSRKRRGVSDTELHTTDSFRRMSAVKFQYGQESLTSLELYEKYGKQLKLSQALIYSRICAGWSVADAVSTPVQIKRSEKYEINGESKTIREWSVEYDIPTSVVYQRVSTCGLSVVDALTRPYVQEVTGGIRNNFSAPMYELYGSSYSMRELEELTGMNRSTLNSRMKRGMTAQQAVETPVKKHKLAQE